LSGYAGFADATFAGEDEDNVVDALEAHDGMILRELDGGIFQSGL